MRFSVPRRVVAFAVVAAAAVGLAACSDSGSGMPGLDHGGSGSMSHTPGHAQGDVEFAQMMIPHHQQALTMSELAATRATGKEIKSVAEKIKSGQQPEIATLSRWLTGWGQPTAQPGGHDMPGMGTMPGMMTDAQMQQLQAASGTDFDRMFARMMIAHHNGAIQMANQVLASTSNTDVKAFAQQVVAAQSAEIDQLQKILDRL